MRHSPTFKEFIVWSLGEIDEPTVVVGLGITDVSYGIPGWGILTQPAIGTGGNWESVILVLFDLPSL